MQNTTGVQGIFGGWTTRSCLGDNWSYINPRAQNQVLCAEGGELHLSTSQETFWKVKIDYPLTSLPDFSSDGKLALGSDEHVAILESRSGKEQVRFETGFRVSVVRFSPDGKQLFAASGEGNVCVHNFDSHKEWKKHVAVNLHPLAPVHFQGDQVWIYSENCQRFVLDAHTGESHDN